MQKEPSVIVGTIIAVVTAIIVLLTAFGLHITNDQQSAILGVVAVLAPLIAGGVIRGKVFSPLAFRRATGRHVADGADGL
jgi:hypothetical protein